MPNISRFWPSSAIAVRFVFGYIVHWIGRAVVICGPWYICSKVETLLRENAPPGIYWPATILLLLISIAIPVYFLADLVKKHDEKRLDNSRHGIEKWFRSHWQTMPTARLPQTRPTT